MDDVGVARPPSLRDVTISRELWDELWPACRELMLEHKREVGQNDPRQELSPDHQAIRRSESLGGLLLLSARVNGSLIGYALWYLVPSLETAGLLLAQQAPWYVAPPWRARGVGLALWRESERQLRLRGVRALFGHYPAEGPGSELGAFFSRRGAKILGTEFFLWLEKAPL